MASSSSSKLTSNMEETPQPPPRPPPPPQQLPSSTATATATRTLTTSINRAQAHGQDQAPASTSHATATLSPSEEDISLAKSSHLTRQEVLRRRVRQIRTISKVYRDHYWALMEDLKVQYREYYWKYGVSPRKEDDERESAGDREYGAAGFNVEGCGETNANNDVSGSGGSNRCTFVGCKLKAMALTKFCHLHILSDPEQKLYKPCKFVIKSAQAGPILCGKPILSATTPSWCNIHSQKSQKHAIRALKKSGFNASTSSRLSSHIPVVIAEYVRHIQSRRRAARNAGLAVDMNIDIKEESTS